MTKPTIEGDVPLSARDEREAVPKEWRRPSLRKLSIAATAQQNRVHIGFDDGNTKKVGSAGSFS
jgi:hypothetical protein